MEVRWTSDPASLFAKPLKILPDVTDSDAARFNAVSRLVLYSSGASYALSKSWTDLALGGAVLGLYLWYKSPRRNVEMLESSPGSAPVSWLESQPWFSWFSAQTVATAPVAADVGKPSKKERAANAEATDVLPTPPTADTGIVRPTNVRNPDGPVKISSIAPPSSAGSGTAAVAATKSYLSKRPGEAFPGAFAAAERLVTGSSGVRGRSQVIPSREDIHNAYRAVPPKFDSAADQDYMSGLVGPYKRVGRLA